MHNIVKKSSRIQSTSNLKNIDFKIFESRAIECNSYDTPITARCPSLLRLITASKYMDAANASKLDDEEKKALLVEFNEKVYGMVLDDTIHLVNEHSDDVQQIKKEWTEQYGYPKCSVSECVKVRRHCGRGRRNKENEVNCQNDDSLYSFYESLYDRVHQYVAHLYDIGMRVDVASLNLSEGANDEKELESVGMSVDTVFAVIRDRVRSRREESQLNSDRFEDGNSKFTIQNASEQSDGVTLMDVLIEKLQKMKNLRMRVAQRLRMYFDDECCDSDCIEMDIEDVAESNICNLVESEEAVQMILQFIQTTKLLRSAFSTGFSFHYWKTEKQYNGESHPWDLKVTPKYKSLKEEILESGFVTKKEWMEFVELKAKKYMKTERARKMKSGRYNWSTRTYQLKEGSPVTIEHLCAIILYCDFSALCTAFSGTFRRMNVFETIESVITRHSHFAVFGALLVECVLDFGENSYSTLGVTRPRREYGPFFCGLNCVLNIGAYAIRLKGPCSTTTKREVALNFAKGNGIIMTLTNNTYCAEDQSFLSCAWISNFAEESEMLWMASKHPLRIVSITIVETAHCYQQFMRSLFLFEQMISPTYGSLVLRLDENKKDYKIVKRFFGFRVHSDDDKGLDQHLMRDFKLFLQNKSEVILNMEIIHEQYRCLPKLVFHSVMENQGNDAKGNANVLRPEWLSKFPCLESVFIVDVNSKYQFEFCLKSLLETVQQVPRSICIMIYDGNRWCDEALTEEISELYAVAGWNIGYKKEAEKLVIKCRE